MNVYVFLVVNVILWSCLSLKLSQIKLKVGSKAVFGDLKNCDSSKNIFFILFTSIPLILVTGLRHDMGTDYLTYKYLYQTVIKNSSFFSLLKTKEAGFAILQKIVGVISNYDIVWLMMVLAIITVVILYYAYYKNSEILWFSIFLVLTLGSYYTSFNTTRQYLSGVLFLLCVEFIYKKSLPKYIISVLLISTIHYSSLIMLPMYWLLRIQWTSRKKVVLNFVALIAIVVLLTNSAFFINIFATLLYGQYSGRDLENLLSLVNVTRPLLFFAVVLFNVKFIDFNNTKDLCWFNSCFYFLILYIISFEFYMVYRLTYFFIPLAILGVVNVIARQNRRFNKIFWGGMVMVYALIANILGQFAQPYAFYWQYLGVR